MASIPNLKLVFSPIPSSIQSTKLPFHICSKPFRASSSLSSSSSRSCSLFIKCSNDTRNKSSGGELMDLFSGFVEEILKVDEIENFVSDVNDLVVNSEDDKVLAIIDEMLNLNKEECKVLGRLWTKAPERTASAKRRFMQQEVEIKKMKEYVNQFQNRAAEIEKCQKKLSEARALVEEAERSLHFVMKTLQN